ncbi:MAG: protein TolQ [Rhodospirillaceae bacterium]|nr:protein TolQ [Rhodospirillaceae bacterium]|tara:strand:+ start:2211 stop:2927 length:717 start_codon:yes stop_codon:yes gene_type:complete
MEKEVLSSAILSGSVSNDMSVWGLFLQADMVVKVVLILLIIASLWSWAIIFEKTLRLRKLWSRADSFEEVFWSGGSLDDLFDRTSKRPADPMSSIFNAAMREWRRSSSRAITDNAGLAQRIERVMYVTLGREMDNAEKHMTFLASVGSTAPFIGLFGTVWGIMDSFQAIAMTKDTSLAVVAPGIAEALFATALGLVAAIPAVLAYNKFSNEFGRYSARLEAFSSEFGAIISRQLEENT